MAETYKAVPQLLGLQRRPSKKTSKARASKGARKAKGAHRAESPEGVLCEAAQDERASKSETLDPARTPYNYVEGPTSGRELWRELCEEADGHVDRITRKDGKVIERHVRADSVIAVQVIHKLPLEATAGLPLDEAVGVARRYADDSDDAMNDIMESMDRPRVFVHENRRALNVHVDEGKKMPTTVDDIQMMLETGIPGAHAHETIAAIDPETGRYCGNVIDSAFFGELNRQFPARMRERGWDLENLDVTDWKRYNADPAYRAERDRAREGHGLSTNEYRARQRAKESLGDALEAEAARDAAHADAQAAMDDAQEMRHAAALAQDDADASRAEAEAARRERDAEAAAQALDIERGRLALTLQEATTRRLAEEEKASRDEAAKARRDVERARADKAKADRDLEAAKADVKEQRDLAKWLGPEGSGVVWGRGTSDEYKEASVKAVRKQRDDAKRELDGIVRKRNDAQRSLDTINADIEDRRSTLDDLDDDVADRKRDLDDLAARYDEGASELAAQRERIRAAHERGTFGFRAVLAAVARAIARACERRFPGITEFLSDRLDSIGEDALNELSPETRVYELAPAPGETEATWTPAQARSQQQRPRPRPHVRRGPTGPSLG